MNCHWIRSSPCWNPSPWSFRNASIARTLCFSLGILAGTQAAASRIPDFVAVRSLRAVPHALALFRLDTGVARVLYCTREFR